MATRFPQDLSAIGSATGATKLLGDDGSSNVTVAINQIPIGSLLNAGGAAVLNVGTSAGTVAAGDDSRFTDARTPATHAASHASGSTDPIKLDDLATPDDNTDLNATSTRHGLCPKLSNVATDALLGTGVFGAVSNIAHATNHNAGGTDPITALGDLTAIGSATITDAKNWTLGSTTGTKFGTATTQKLGFYNATPIVQPAGSVDVVASLVNLGLRAATSNPPMDLGTGAIGCGNITMTDATNLAVGTTTGTKIGTSTAQKLGFFNATPVVQVGGSIDILTGLVNLGLRAATSNPPLNMGTGALTCGAVSCTTVSCTTIANSGTQTFSDAANIAFGTSTGTIIAATVSQKMGFWGKTPIVQPSGANQGAITDSTGGTAGFTLSDVTATPTQTLINNNFASLARLVDNMRSALVNSGIMKGSA